MTVELNGESLTIEDVVSVSRDKEQVTISEKSLETVEESRKILEDQIESGDRIYGINTGVGALSDRTIDEDQAKELQENLVNSHACGVGEPLDEDEARAVMLLRLNSLIIGNSGVRRQLVTMIESCLNEKIYPYIPRKGSVGASGDLAPLAHMTLAITGKGKLRDKKEKEWVNAEKILEEKGLTALNLKEKEGLALLNGTNFMAALGCLALHDAEKLADAADLAGALSLESLKGISDAFRGEIHELRPYEGQKMSAKNIRELIEDSQLVKQPGEDMRIQDSYSLRCMPQVHGATRDIISSVEETLETEINSVTDNPIVLDEGYVVSGGNFHGQPLALKLDSLKNAVAELADISERRTAKLVDGDNNFDLPEFLSEECELTSGLMIPQYTAAALVSENKTLSHPSSTDSIPTSANQEDHVSMGANSANHLSEIVENTFTVLAIEILTAYQALTIRDNEKLGKGTSQAFQRIDSEIGPVEKNDIIRDKIVSVRSILRHGDVTEII